jgi:Fe2+ transport system protein FeoA
MLEESFASHLRREIFDLEVEGATAEEIKAEIMAQLAERGLAEGAEVEVIQEDGLTEIIMKTEQEVEDGQ